MADPDKKAPRRIKRHSVVPKYDVNGRLFDDEPPAKLWADVLHRAELRVAKTKPDLSDARASSLAIDMAEAMMDYAQSEGVSGDSDDDSPEKDEPIVTPSLPESAGYTNGVGAHHG